MLSPNVQNYLYGKGRLYFRRANGAGYFDLGNIPKFEIGVELEKDEHFSSRSGTKEKDLEVILGKKANAAFDLEEYSIENLNLAFMGDGIHTGGQQAGFLDALAVTLAPDRFIDLGKSGLSFLRIDHGAVTTGPFQAGETVTGGASKAVGKIAWRAPQHLEVVNVTGGKFQTGETLTGTTSKAATVALRTEIQADVVVTEKAVAPTIRYQAGKDYDLDVEAGLIRELSGGALVASKCAVSADHAALSTKSIRPLVNSQTRGELLFIGDPDQGPKLRVACWNVNLSISGAMGLISDSVSSIPMQAEILADRLNHPKEPFFRVTELTR